MRRATGGSCALAIGRLDAAPWLFFLDDMWYSITPPINWSTFAVAAQYQDGHGNISQPACDDIAIEGMPPPPATTTPTPTATATQTPILDPLPPTHTPIPTPT
ncbi:MAG: hypothetical protein U0768_09540 [Anaerolineae bacterium]